MRKHFWRWLLLLIPLLMPLAPALGEDAPADPEASATPPSAPAPADTATSDASSLDRVESAIVDLVERIKPSIVVISFSDRDGRTQGVGSGFVVDSDGLIATNFHVLGEARPISVRLLDGRRFDVQSIHATERSQDLAILKIDAHDLPALELGDSDQLQQGQTIVAFGNPQGLEHSVVTGVVSGLRENVDGMSVIQLAIPIERGNSGGPAVDLAGRVQGLLTLKSLVKENLGYAVTINTLKPLLESPNPIRMDKWLTIGRLNPRQWAPPADVRWTQRAGHIRVDGVGVEFGGRSLCLAVAEPPAVPFEVAVSVKINEADGAAGLVLHSDGKDRHYGFYPSSGRLRFARFDGPSVYEWHVLFDERSRALQPADWNRLKVRIEADRILCYCNEQLVYESTDGVFSTGRVGLVKFRHTTAEFKDFAVADSIPSQQPNDEVRDRVTALVDPLSVAHPAAAETVAALAALEPSSQIVLEQQARELEQRAQRLRELSQSVHEQRVRDRLLSLLDQPEEDIDILHAALLIAALDNTELRIEDYLAVADDLAAEFKSSVAADVAGPERLKAFHRFLFEDHGFHGSRTNYYHVSNSYLNEVIDDREGLPITLSVLYMAVARRAGMDVVGIGLPGHFVVRYRPESGEPQLVDVFDGGTLLSGEEAVKLVESGGRLWDDSYLTPQTPRQILERMLRNLLNVAGTAEDRVALLRYVDAVLTLNPESAQDRLFRAVLCYQSGRIEDAIAEADWVLERQPEGIALERVEELRQTLEEARE